MKIVFSILCLICWVFTAALTVEVFYRAIQKLVNAIKTKNVKIIVLNILVTVILLGLWTLILISMHPFSVLSRAIQSLQ